MRRQVMSMDFSAEASEHANVQRREQAERQTEADDSSQSPATPTSKRSLLGAHALDERANAPVRSDLMLNMQHTYGNRALQRFIKMQRTASAPTYTPTDEDISERIQRKAGSGSALEPGVQNRLESGIGADLSNVRVHTDSEADSMARSVNAEAFTTGHDIFFSRGAYNPDSSDGLHLLAHEATHTVQQAQGPVAGTPAPGGVSISDPSDAYEQAADATAKRVAGPGTGQTDPAGTSGPGAEGALQRSGMPVLLQRKGAVADQETVAEDAAMPTLLWVLDDVLENQTNRLISDLSPKYQTAFEKLYKAMVGHDMARNKIFGRERREIFDEAILALSPVIARATSSQRAFLQQQRATLLRAEANDRIDNSLLLDQKLVEIPDDRHPHEQAAVFRAALPRLVQTLQIANEQLLRLGHEELEEVLEHLAKGGHGNALAKLAALHGLLGLADGWLLLSDEELQHEIAHVHGFFPGVTTFGELLKAIVEIGGGAVAFTASIGAAIAKATGETVTAAAAMEVAGEAGHMLGNVVAGIEIVHGIFVLLNPDATRAQKERAAFGVASGGAWFIGKRIGGAAMGAAASVAVVATYLELKLAAHLYWQGNLGISTMLMRETFEYMQQTGASIARVSDELAKAGLLLQEEQDPIKIEPLMKIQEETGKLLATEIDWFLQHCLPSGKDMGVGSNDPAAWPGNHRILAQVFAPLQPLRAAKSGPELAAAATTVLEKITWCLAHAGDIVVAGAKGHDLHDVEAAAAKPGESHEE